MEYTTQARTADQFINEINTVKAQDNFTVDMAEEMSKAWVALKATLPVDEQSADEVRVQAAFNANVAGTTSPTINVKVNSPVHPVTPVASAAVVPAKTVDEFVSNMKITNTYSNSEFQALKRTLPLVEQADAEKKVREILINKTNIARTN